MRHKSTSFETSLKLKNNLRDEETEKKEKNEDKKLKEARSTTKFEPFKFTEKQRSSTIDRKIRKKVDLREPK